MGAENKRNRPYPTLKRDNTSKFDKRISKYFLKLFLIEEGLQIKGFGDDEQPEKIYNYDAI